MSQKVSPLPPRIICQMLLLEHSGVHTLGAEQLPFKGRICSSIQSRVAEAEKVKQHIVTDRHSPDRPKIEGEIMEGPFRDWIIKRMIFIITYQLETVKSIDLILVIKNPQITESSMHIALTKNSYFYSEL